MLEKRALKAFLPKQKTISLVNHDGLLAWIGAGIRFRQSLVWLIYW